MSTATTARPMALSIEHLNGVAEVAKAAAAEAVSATADMVKLAQALEESQRENAALRVQLQAARKNFTIEKVASVADQEIVGLVDQMINDGVLHENLRTDTVASLKGSPDAIYKMASRLSSLSAQPLHGRGVPKHDEDGGGDSREIEWSDLPRIGA